MVPNIWFHSFRKVAWFSLVAWYSPKQGACTPLAQRKNIQSSISLFLISLFKISILYLFAAAKSLQSCPTLCDPIDGSPAGSPVPGILQARTLEWVAISFSSAWKWKVKVKSLSHVWVLATPWTAAYQAPPSVGFSRQEYWSGVPLPSPLYLFTLHLRYSHMQINIRVLEVHAIIKWAMNNT